uniref:Uncharacterized protein n=1 Tax=Arundo donax TaxID=35708 RepID=A0A0A8ZQ43_ARUDO
MNATTVYQGDAFLKQWLHHPILSVCFPI